jgi:hypothetical protein
MYFDLRKQDASREIERVEQAFGTRFDPQTEMRKRRSVGFRTDRNTWVRIEQQPIARYAERGNNGPERATILHDVIKPQWHQGFSWIDPSGERMWRADETDYIAARHVIPWGHLRTDPDLSDEWWNGLNSSLDALVKHTTSRVAIRQEAISKTVNEVFPDVDTSVDEWVTAHGDFYWQNLTAPEFWILDWEDWGTAPRGFDASSLWHDSFLVPGLSERVYRERREDLDSRSGLISQLMRCARTIAMPITESIGYLEPAKMHAQRIVDQLTRSR